MFVPPSVWMYEASAKKETQPEQDRLQLDTAEGIQRFFTEVDQNGNPWQRSKLHILQHPHSCSARDGLSYLEGRVTSLQISSYINEKISSLFGGCFGRSQEVEAEVLKEREVLAWARNDIGRCKVALQSEAAAHVRRDEALQRRMKAAQNRGIAEAALLELPFDRELALNRFLQCFSLALAQEAPELNLVGDTARYLESATSSENRIYMLDTMRILMTSAKKESIGSLSINLVSLLLKRVKEDPGRSDFRELITDFLWNQVQTSRAQARLLHRANVVSQQEALPSPIGDYSSLLFNEEVEEHFCEISSYKSCKDFRILNARSAISGPELIDSVSKWLESKGNNISILAIRERTLMVQAFALLVSGGRSKPADNTWPELEDALWAYHNAARICTADDVLEVAKLLQYKNEMISEGLFADLVRGGGAIPQDLLQADGFKALLAEHTLGTWEAGVDLPIILKDASISEETAASISELFTDPHFLSVLDKVQHQVWQEELRLMIGVKNRPADDPINLLKKQPAKGILK